MKSKVIFIPTILAALDEIGRNAGGSFAWQPQNSLQAKLLGMPRLLDRFQAEEKRIWVSPKKTVSHEQEIIDANGSAVRFDFAATSYTDIKVELNAVGMHSSLMLEGTEYSAALLKDGSFTVNGPVQSFQVYECEDLPAAVCLYAANGDQIFFSMPAGISDEDDLFAFVDRMRQTPKLLCPCDTLIYPAIDYDLVAKSALEGLKIRNKDGYMRQISPTSEQIKFRMDHSGTPLKNALDALAETIQNGNKADKSLFKIEQAFCLWIEREDFPDPILYGYFDRDSWKISQK